MPRPDPVGLADFVGLYSAQVVQVRRVVAARVSDVGLAEDFVSETFTRALRAARSGVAPQNPGAWLTTIAINLIRDHFRLWRVQREVLTDDFWQLADQGVGPEQAAVDSDTAVTVQRALGGLSRDHRESVWLRFWEGLSVVETAVALGCRPGTVKSREHRAKTELRVVLDGRFDGGCGV